MSNYWQERFTQLEQAMNAYGRSTHAEVDEAFRKAQAEMQKEIDVWYARIVRNNQITLKEARKLLSKNELTEFHWSVEEYIKHGEENGLNGQWMKQLENASAKYHISRLEALKIHTQQIAEKAFGNELDAVDRMARKVYTEDYYRAAFEIQKGIGVGFNIGQIDENRLSKIIAKPWAADGKNFSSRIWQSKTAMVNELHQQLTKICVLGKSPSDAIAELSKYVDKRFQTSRAQAGRLIMTEQAFFASAGQRNCYQELGVEEFEIVATLDNHTSEICQSMDGKHFPMSEYIEGVTAPPFHVWCRSTTCPYFDDEFTADSMRAARDKEGNTEYVPADMKYGEWKEKYVDKPETSKRENEAPENEKGLIKSKELFYDNISQWQPVPPQGAKKATDLTEYEANGVTYKVDGRGVVLDYSQHEKEVADIIATKYGKDVQMVPRVNVPQGISTPDYLIDGKKYDLKVPKGNGKNTLYGIIKSKKRQSNNFVVSMDKCNMDDNEVKKQVESIYKSQHTMFVDEIVVIRGNDIAKAYRRKK